jgi:glycosyltransferase involved in cell wall biosynthesis
MDSSSIDHLAHHVVMLEEVFSQCAEFDIIHFHIDYLHFPLSDRSNVANLTTLHGRLDIPDLQPVYDRYPHMPVVSISNSQRDPLPGANWVGTVYHGLPLDQFSFQPQPGKYLAFLGRTSPEKGLDKAIEIAKAAQIPLKIAAKIDRVDREYFDTKIRPLLDHPLIEFIGEIGYPDKNQFLGNALALLFPIAWEEPFGLVMIESMACGTPVIAHPRGSVVEVIEEGRSGLLVEDVESAVSAVKHVVNINRAECRQRFEQQFSAPRMASDYLAIYEGLIRKEASVVAFNDGVSVGD